MKSNPRPAGLTAFALVAITFAAQAATFQLTSWNNLGMHCMDSDYSVFSILPPYNTIHAQLVVSNKLNTNGAYSITYQAIGDPAGSTNSHSVGKGNFYDYDLPLFGVDLAPNAGLAGWPMPGNSAIPMVFERTNSGVQVSWWRAEGIPITPYDDLGRKNPYPMMRIIARNATNGPVATNNIVLPVSDEMDCRACHASGSGDDARPAAGWAWSANPERDFRLNILRLHDENRDAAEYAAILASSSYTTQGLYRSVVAFGKPVLCAGCHASEAMPGLGHPEVPPLTQSIHGRHADVVDPEAGLTLNNVAHRSACYSCHPGADTRCLRGAMGAAVGADAHPSMHCQACHGSMTQMALTTRTGWLNEPNCQSCHTGSATNAVFRFTSVFTNGLTRSPVDVTFATDPGVPGPGFSLYRFSSGHGGLQCSACHGSTHAEFPTSHTNDNVRNVGIQGHVGVLSECVACHNNNPTSGGPHGMHTVGSLWTTGHNNNNTCRTCHGLNNRGTELSEAKADRLNFSSGFGSKNFWRGYRIGCYTCHNGPSQISSTPWRAASIGNVAASVGSGIRAVVPIVAVDTNTSPQPVQVRVIRQPVNGFAGVTNWFGTNWAVIYSSLPGFVGTDTLNYAAWNGYIDSPLRTATLTVTQALHSLTASVRVPPSYPARWPVPMSVTPIASNLLGTVSYEWRFGDGPTVYTNQFPAKLFNLPGPFPWTVITRLVNASVNVSCTNSGIINITPPMVVSVSGSGGAVQINWPANTANVILEQSSSLGAQAVWSPATQVPSAGPGYWFINVPASGAERYYRLRQI